MTTYFSQLANFFLTIIRLLWLSISSSQFYKEVYLNYKGYGLKYVLNLSLLCSLALSLYLVVFMNNIASRLENPHESGSGQDIEYIFNQVPEMNYDGSTLSYSIESQRGDSQLILSQSGQKIAIIDLGNNLPSVEIMKTPIILRKNSLHFNLLDRTNNPIENFIIKYSEVFGQEPTIINGAYLKDKLVLIIKSWGRIIIYLLMPITGFLFYCNVVFDKLFLILIIFILTKFSSYKQGFGAAARVVLFSSGFAVISLPFSLFNLNFISYATSIIQIWINLLMIFGLFREKIPVFK